MIVAVSFSTDKFSELRQRWEMEAGEPTLSTSTFGRDEEDYCGGAVVLVDWRTKQVVAERRLPCAAGLALLERGRIAVATQRSLVVLDSALRVVEEKSHPLFNNLHRMCRTPDGGLVVASSGIDSILRLNRDLEVVDAWHATQHGYPMDQRGVLRSLDFGKDHSGLFYPTAVHTTHVNSVLVEGTGSDAAGWRILATLFWQGETVMIDWKTGSVTTLLGNLKKPHAVQSHGSDVLVADTERGRIVTLDGVVRVSVPSCKWLQDFAVLADGGYLVCDGNGARVLELSADGVLVSECLFRPELKVFQAVVVD